MTLDYEYHGLMSETWDLFRGDTSNWEDRFFYLTVIKEYGEPVLDVGCGTGRLLLDFLAQGIDADGVDNSPEMLALCRQKAESQDLNPTLYQQYMESLDLPRRYKTILVPSSSFLLLLDVAKAQEAMRRFYAHLLPGGVLGMPFMILWKEGDPIAHEDWKLTGEKTRLTDGALVRRWSRAWYDVENQLEHTEERYEVTLDGQVIAAELHRQSPATRWYTQVQAEELYLQAGFSDLRLVSEFSFDPVKKDDPIFTVLGRKPG
ncbi:MAG TPA: class I SAM-dependent methyltransferase [Anaerolineales bacterium]|nr:class I SAM-dependent methyltransferase [Anaerolineales bacterium]